MFDVPAARVRDGDRGRCSGRGGCAGHRRLGDAEWQIIDPPVQVVVGDAKGAAVRTDGRPP
ncbi:hypothetical protein [Actinomadura sp. DC4]|uniref:hypothetical protein n=1 Tax=Actinomadura sp. DC4 TaxID=3055069 RepID=UPI0025AEE4F0|nr:hypothetical protein [Actinomadura sp. DC4]MDN3359530.1 hypothetical protein [Actinomadura sp. DC4]